MIKTFLNPEGHQNLIYGSKFTAILLNAWILPVGGASAVEGLQSTGLPCLVQMKTWENVFSWIFSVTVGRCLIHFKIVTHFFFKQQFNLIFFIYLIKKNISIKVLKEALGVKDYAEGAEYDDLEEANIGTMYNLIEKRVGDQQQGSREL